MPLPSRLPSLGARLLVTVAALAGLFAMHGLADHGVPATPLAAAGSASAPMADHHAPPPGGTTEHGTAELCLALLGLVFVLVAGFGGVRTALPAPHRRPLRWRALAPRARFRDPPDLFRLSVQRC